MFRSFMRFGAVLLTALVFVFGLMAMSAGSVAADHGIALPPECETYARLVAEGKPGYESIEVIVDPDAEGSDPAFTCIVVISDVTDQVATSNGFSRQVHTIRIVTLVTSASGEHSSSDTRQTEIRCFNPNGKELTTEAAAKNPNCALPA